MFYNLLKEECQHSNINRSYRQNIYNLYSPQLYSQHIKPKTMNDHHFLKGQNLKVIHKDNINFIHSGKWRIQICNTKRRREISDTVRRGRLQFNLGGIAQQSHAAARMYLPLFLERIYSCVQKFRGCLDHKLLG